MSNNWKWSITNDERKTLRKKNCRKCFLGNGNSYPVCKIDCKYNCHGLLAARKRASSVKGNKDIKESRKKNARNVLKKVERIAKEKKCGWFKG